MSETELDLVSIATRLLHLEQDQVILKKYIAKLKRQLEAQEQRFNDRPEPPQLENLIAQIAVLQQRFDLGIADMSVISEPPIELEAETEQHNLDFQYQLVCDRPNSRAVLVEALSVARERLIIVCPWLNCNSINDELLQKFRDCLNRGCAIDIGWGYLGDRQKIGKGWRYNALADLQELASEYPGQFSLNLLGTHENYLVCDSSFAMLGSHNFLTNSDQSAEKEVGIRTGHCQIVKQLIERFDSSQVLNEEEIESRFIESSDYLDRADYLEGLAADAAEGEIDLEDSAEDLDDESEASLEPVVNVEEFWERYTQGERDFTGINLAGADLRGKNLAAGVNLSNANLNKANLNGVSWQMINLSGATLKEANMSNAFFSSTNFSNANLSRANLSQANLSSANLTQANLVNANLSQANLQSAKLEKSKLRKASLRGTLLEYANFSEADFTGANLNGAKLSQQTKFTNANLAQANLSGLYLSLHTLFHNNITFSQPIHLKT
ncbi:pentapeptide repeat-containing protein [Microcoleus sp. bin38.metabat.b11b12b14.051]|uniref:pentapeptide repeat-containing protein n=1 Tax=Microcoleus sp. bin38.metabat.b11b12b14.051 TaxID=2742709 RepID=UPI0025DC6A07|nr:pentapeptide repeat-containing protein [Microcoleus sp. bin38.metabat.b11b12b14.051]